MSANLSHLVAVLITCYAGLAGYAVSGRVNGEVTVGNGNFTFSRIVRFINLFNRLRSIIAIMIVFSNIPLEVAANNGNLCRFSRPSNTIVCVYCAANTSPSKVPFSIVMLPT